MRMICESGYLVEPPNSTAAFFEAFCGGLMATYIGGIGFFIGPIIGAIFVTYLSLVLSDLTTVWQLYFACFSSRL